MAVETGKKNKKKGSIDEIIEEVKVEKVEEREEEESGSRENKQSPVLSPRSVCIRLLSQTSAAVLQ